MTTASSTPPDRRPNIIFVLADDHAASAIGAYGSLVNETPNIDRIGREGVRLDSCFCTNALCSPSRASILTGTYSHVNGVTTLDTPIDASQPAFPEAVQSQGYQTSIFGKWHLGHGPLSDPQGFDTWEILRGQGRYFDPEFLTADGSRDHTGYVTDIITELGLEWIRNRDRDRPFCTIISHKAPHVPREWDDAHASLYQNDVVVPSTFFDDFEGRSQAAHRAGMRVADLPLKAFKEAPPAGLSETELTLWKYQRMMEDYLRCCASIDDNVGRILDLLEAEGIAEDTILIYTSDQGYFLGEHGWRDKRFMYEPSLRMPFLMRYPREIDAGTVVDDIITNVDIAQTLCDYAQAAPPSRAQGRSFRPLLHGTPVADWPQSMYYRYWMNDDAMNHSTAHYGVRTERHKLIYYYGEGLGLPGTSERSFDPEWEMFDLEIDPDELHNVYGDPRYVAVRDDLEAKLDDWQRRLGDTPLHTSSGAR